jgi:2-amino-4-hydroxy-6-hydroxymethyldihydropteridine diphosphokinase
MTHWAYISIGSNLGNLLQNCCLAIETLCGEPAIALIERSPFYRTSPVDYIAQDWFLNTALKIQTDLTPRQLLHTMQSVQQLIGRKTSTVRYGPRIIDLDIIFFEDQILETPELTIPHPRMHKRRFVLQPICDIDPTIIHPMLGKSVQDLLNQLVTNDQEIERCSFGC